MNPAGLTLVLYLLVSKKRHDVQSFLAEVEEAFAGRLFLIGASKLPEAEHIAPETLSVTGRVSTSAQAAAISGVSSTLIRGVATSSAHSGSSGSAPSNHMPKGCSHPGRAAAF